ncbi:hypothetical protein CTAYLR_000229 [Chrysophaeum taylorii]|uniref:1-phosphatidylinositol 4-kinase n=1 Tax=Chrysophaeum taylorii TaxID=2483200 RepID=A0AAD7UEG8_9STRA|nr:hypothetical protein CTAYLR_000229 [Chrysophaeum taylorii]
MGRASDVIAVVVPAAAEKGTEGTEEAASIAGTEEASAVEGAEEAAEVAAEEVAPTREPSPTELESLWSAVGSPEAASSPPRAWEQRRRLPVTAAWSGAMEGPLLKQNTSHGGSEYARKVHCVLMGYTLFEFDTEQEARAMLWPRAEADVIGVSPAPTNSAALRSSSLSMARADASVTFVYTTNAGERVCAVAPSPRECERWIVALTLGVELLLLSGLPEAAGGAARCVAHAAPSPETTASHCAASGQQFGYTVTRHLCAASGRAFSAAHMAPAPLPLPGIGLAHATRLSDACAQAQQLLNASRCRARLLAAATHAAELEATLVRKYKADGRELWLCHSRGVITKRRGSDPARRSMPDDLDDEPLSPSVLFSDESLEARREREKEVAVAAHATYVATVLDPARTDPARLILELHYLCSAPPPFDDPLADAAAEKSKKPPPPATGAPPAPRASTDERTSSVAAPPSEGSDLQPMDDDDEARASVASTLVAPTDANGDLRAALTPPAHAGAVRDALSLLAEVRAADDDREATLVTKRNLVFYLPQLAHIYYRILPPRDAEAALRATLVEDLLLGASRRSFRFALRLAWFLVAYLEDRGAAPARRPHILRLLVELEAAAAFSYAGTTDAIRVARRRGRGGGDPWTLRNDTVAAAAMARRGPVAGEPSPFAGAVALELLPRAPAWLALELRRAAVALHKAAAKALEALDVPTDSLAEMVSAPCTPSVSQTRSDAAQYHDAPDDVLAREMRFVRAMCDVAETMRGVELSQRPARLKYELQALPRRTPLGHSPIGPTVVRRKRETGPQKSGRVSRVPPNEGHVFKTKARAPTLMLLETVDDDVAPLARIREERKEPDDDLVNQRRELRALVAPVLEEGPPEATAVAATRTVGVSSPPAAEAVTEESGIARRVASMPKILEAAYNAAQEEDDDEPETRRVPKTLAGSGSKKQAAAPPPRRVSSMNSLAALPENPKRGSAPSTPSKKEPDDETDDATTATALAADAAAAAEATTTAAAAEASAAPAATTTAAAAAAEEDAAAAQATTTAAAAAEADAAAAAAASEQLATTIELPDDLSRLADEPVASRSAARAEVVLALRQRPTLGLKLERLALLDTASASLSTASALDADDDDDGDDDDEYEAAIAATARKSLPATAEHPQLLLAADADTDDLEVYAKAKRKPGFGEPWVVQRERVRRASPIGDEPSWNLTSLIVKSNDDLRQEVCALQIIAACNDAFEAAGLAGDNGGLWLRNYSIVPTGASTGIIETMPDAVSLDALKKNSGVSLPQHFLAAHGRNGPVALARARKAFISSMAAYSLVCYILGLKDRHNGNLLLDTHGHVIHIDFGFMLGQAPGGSFSLERVPFKLTTEHVETMGGWNSDGFADFVVLLACGFIALQAHASKILALVEIMAKDSPFPCFRSGPAAVDKMRSRFKLGLTSNLQVANHVTELVRQSYNAYGTRQYDSFQYLTNGIYS